MSTEDERCLRRQYCWPAEGLVPPEQWLESRGETKPLAILAHWMRRAGHEFEWKVEGGLTCDNADYTVGTLAIDGVVSRYWMCHVPYFNAEMSVEGFGTFLSPDELDYPSLESLQSCGPDGPPITAEDFPVAHKILANNDWLSFVDPLVLYEHPETKELFSWPEWQSAKAAAVKSVAWKMRTTDGCPLCLNHYFTSDVDPTCLLRLFEEKGVDFCVRDASKS